MAGPVSNRIGRRDAIAFACFWWLLGTAVQAGCNGVGMLVAGRFLNGVCVGITSSQVPVYLVEISEKGKRGSVVVIQQWAIEWGIFIMYFVGYGMVVSRDLLPAFFYFLSLSYGWSRAGGFFFGCGLTCHHHHHQAVRSSPERTRSGPPGRFSLSRVSSF